MELTVTCPRGPMHCWAGDTVSLWGLPAATLCPSSCIHEQGGINYWLSFAQREDGGLWNQCVISALWKPFLGLWSQRRFGHWFGWEQEEGQQQGIVQRRNHAAPLALCIKLYFYSSRVCKTSGRKKGEGWRKSGAGTPRQQPFPPF